ncbi:MAG: hypothetical protein M1819_003282 [Sarea resinae]|nr:MAG: hypothetical protein M1819_003282 [Sarea resinae]
MAFTFPHSAVSLDILPNELLLQILASFPTRTLLPLAAVSHRFYDLVLRILHHRLILASTLQDHSLLLECFHPTRRLTEPSLPCEYMGTEGLTSEIAPGEDVYPELRNAGALGKLNGVYSRFRPRPDAGHKIRRRHPAGDVPGHPNTSTTFPSFREEPKSDIVSQTIDLDGDEYFSQLCAKTMLIRHGPRHGVFLSFVEVAEGVIRVWRNWLGKQAALKPSMEDSQLPSTSAQGQCDRRGQERMLFVDSAKNVGIKFRVTENKTQDVAPILRRKDEDLPVSYNVEYEELRIRTTHLLLKIEHAVQKEENHSGKAMVFGSFDLTV